MKNIRSVIMVVAIVIAVGAAAITINGYDSVYAESGTRGGGFNIGSSHNTCTAAAAGADCKPHTDSGKHTGLFN